VIARFLEALVELATLARRVTEIDRRLAVETRARTEDTVWLRRELGLHVAPEYLPEPCSVCGATHGRMIARAIKPFWNQQAASMERRWCRLLRCVVCGCIYNAYESDAIVEGDAPPREERPS
jgi:hypothetical protein